MTALQRQLTREEKHVRNEEWLHDMECMLARSREAIASATKALKDSEWCKEEGTR